MCVFVCVLMGIEYVLNALQYIFLKTIARVRLQYNDKRLTQLMCIKFMLN